MNRRRYRLRRQPARRLPGSCPSARAAPPRRRWQAQGWMSYSRWWSHRHCRHLCHAVSLARPTLVPLLSVCASLGRPFQEPLLQARCRCHSYCYRGATGRPPAPALRMTRHFRCCTHPQSRRPASIWLQLPGPWRPPVATEALQRLPWCSPGATDLQPRPAEDDPRPPPVRLHAPALLPRLSALQLPALHPECRPPPRPAQQAAKEKSAALARPKPAAVVELHRQDPEALVPSWTGPHRATGSALAHLSEPVRQRRTRCRRRLRQVLHGQARQEPGRTLRPDSRCRRCRVLVAVRPPPLALTPRSRCHSQRDRPAIGPGVAQHYRSRSRRDRPALGLEVGQHCRSRYRSRRDRPALELGVGQHCRSRYRSRRDRPAVGRRLGRGQHPRSRGARSRCRSYRLLAGERVRQGCLLHRRFRRIPVALQARTRLAQRPLPRCRRNPRHFPERVPQGWCRHCYRPAWLRLEQGLPVGGFLRWCVPVLLTPDEVPPLPGR
mmetsp:Transcript_101054/g.231786  ORF Transcript_101054/g.231786 Transcript_101054/m.231786 type:complete len:494 (+) Transcript_101054:800-2281(+)